MPGVVVRPMCTSRAPFRSLPQSTEHSATPGLRELACTPTGRSRVCSTKRTLCASFSMHPVSMSLQQTRFVAGSSSEWLAGALMRTYAFYRLCSTKSWFSSGIATSHKYQHPPTKTPSATNRSRSARLTFLPEGSGLPQVGQRTAKAIVQFVHKLCGRQEGQGLTGHTYERR